MQSGRGPAPGHLSPKGQRYNWSGRFVVAEESRGHLRNGQEQEKKKSKLMKRKLIKTSSCHRQLLSSPATADLPLHMLLLPSNPQQQLTLIGCLLRPVVAP